MPFSAGDVTIKKLEDLLNDGWRIVEEKSFSNEVFIIYILHKYKDQGN